MKLEQFYVFPVQSALNAQKRKVIEAQINENATLFEQKVEYKWLKRGEEKFLRILAEPVTVEIVFHDDRVELYGAAPAWARVLFTKARKKELQERIQDVLLAAGFVN
jgi:hypothetical protein